MTLQEFLDWLKALIEEFAPALAVMFWDYEQMKEDETKHQALDAKVNLEMEKNHESVDQKYTDCSDLDVVNDAISSGSTKPPGSSDPKG